MDIKNRLKFGFSLVEVLIFVTIVVLFFVTAAAVVTNSLRNMTINQHQIRATRYAEELLEWIRGQKEVDWNAFATNYTAASPGKTYCFTDLSWSNLGSCSAGQKIASLFTRQATLINDGNFPPAQINISITVKWQEPNGAYSIPINSVFYIWE